LTAAVAACPIASTRALMTLVKKKEELSAPPFLSGCYRMQLLHMK
jgi:hypothetical protein